MAVVWRIGGVKWFYQLHHQPWTRRYAISLTAAKEEVEKLIILAQLGAK